MDILAKRYRSLVHSLIYLESLVLVVGGFYPSKAYLEMPPFFYLINSLSVFMAFYCDTNIQLIFNTGTVALFLLVLRPVCFLDPKNAIGLLSSFFMWLCFFVACCCFAMVAIYISKLNTKLATTNRENEKLLDGMHEGLLILSKRDRETMFCNRPAQKLITAYLGATSALLEERNLKYTVFEAVKITMDSKRETQSATTT